MTVNKEVTIEEDNDNKKKSSSKKRNKTGLGSALMDPETLRRIVKAGGDARAKDIESLRAAGKKGGDMVLQTYGVSYFKEIGAKKKCGKNTTAERYSLEVYSSSTPVTLAGNSRNKKNKKDNKNNIKNGSVDYSSGV